MSKVKLTISGQIKIVSSGYSDRFVMVDSDLCCELENGACCHVGADQFDRISVVMALNACTCAEAQAALHAAPRSYYIRYGTPAMPGVTYGGTAGHCTTTARIEAALAVLAPTAVGLYRHPDKVAPTLDDLEAVAYYLNKINEHHVTTGRAAHDPACIVPVAA
jgi:hypothetical protein